MDRLGSSGLDRIGEDWHGVAGTGPAVTGPERIGRTGRDRISTA